VGEAAEGNLDLADAGSAKAQPALPLLHVARVVGQKEPNGGRGVNLPISLPCRWDGSHYPVADADNLRDRGGAEGASADGEGRRRDRDRGRQVGPSCQDGRKNWPKP
jgi:hypothetical protein